MKRRPQSAVKSSTSTNQQPVQSKPKPEWNTNLNENPHKLSRAELLQKKLNCKSKNELQAREELQEKLEKLRSGKVPREYKPFTQKGVKKYQANEAFIKDKNLKQEYENRSYVSQHIIQERQRKLQGHTVDREPLSDPSTQIGIKRETTEVKFTQAFPSTHQNSQIYPSNQVNSDLDEISQISNMINSSPEHQNFKEQTFQPPYSYENTYQQQYQREVQQEEKATEDDPYDYLDYRENEQKLQQLRAQNLSQYQNILDENTSTHLSLNMQKDTYKPQMDDLDQCFQNLNLMLGNKQTSNYPFSERDTNKDDSPRSLIPNYQDLIQFSNIKSSDQNSVPLTYRNQQNQVDSHSNYFNYSQAPKGQDYEPQISQNKVLLNPNQVLQNQQQPYQEQEMRWVQNFKPFESVEQPKQTELLDDDEEEMKRMRELLQNTQQEIDRIIQGSNNVSEIYNASKTVSKTPVMQTNISTFYNSQNAMSQSHIRGGAVVKEIELKPANPFTYNPAAQTHQENINSMNQQSYQQYRPPYYQQEELQPRPYPFPQQSHMKMEVSQIPFHNQALQQHMSGDSLSLKQSIAVHNPLAN